MALERGGATKPSQVIPNNQGGDPVDQYASSPPITIQTKSEEILISNGNQGLNSPGKPHTKVKEKDKFNTKMCIARTENRPFLHLPAERINARAQNMKDHALIGKFMGFQPTEQDLRGQILAKWKLKLHFDLQLGS